MEIRSTAPIAIVGAGTMGVGIAQIAATAGHHVTILDMNEEALARSRSGLAASLDAAVARGRLMPDARAALESRLVWSTDLALVARTALVVEAIVERLEPKRHLFGSLARVVGVDTLLATNTSSLGIGDIASVLAKPGRFIGLHFFNPVPAMKLVEVIAGPQSDPLAVDAAMQLMRAWGKSPVRVRDVPGFIVNRVARPYYAEGFIALSEGVEPATIDAALTDSGGFRMGPLALADLIGHDVNYAVASSVYEAAVGAPRFRPQKAQSALVWEGQLGRKTGRGVYDYAQSLPVAVYRQPVRLPQALRFSDPSLLAPLVEACRSSGLDIQEDRTVPAECLRIDDTLVALGDGRRLVDRPDVDVLVDHARDFSSAKTIVVTPRDDGHADTAAGFLRAADRRMLCIPDRPGQIVLRTLAQIANAAADTVIDKIASADDVETAMMYGANHPEGPLGWARRIGCDRVRTALHNIDRVTADMIYEPSPLLGRD